MPGSPIRRARKEAAARAAREAETQNLPARNDYPPELKAAILDDAIAALSRGETVKAIAARHQMPVPTLTAWMIVDKRCDEARAQFVGMKLADALHLQENGKDQLEVTRGERLFRSWGWIAERRLPQLFMPPKETGNDIPIQINIGIARPDEDPRTITVNAESESAVVPNTATDVH